MHHGRVFTHLPEVVIAARMEEKPDLLYDLSGRQALLKQLILCGEHPCAERLALTSSLWMLAYTLMTLRAALHVLQVKEEAVEANIGPAITLAALKEPLYVLAPYHRHYVRREFRAMSMFRNKLYVYNLFINIHNMHNMYIEYTYYII